MSGPLEIGFANLYERQLQEADPSVTVKRVPLKFSASDRTIYYLFFTTHDPTGALELNETLDKAKLYELNVRWILRQDRHVKWLESMGQAPLFETGPLRAAPSKPAQRTVDTIALGQDILKDWDGRSPSLKDIFRSLASSAVYVGDIRRALSSMKASGTADYKSIQGINDPIKIVKN